MERNGPMTRIALKIAAALGSIAALAMAGRAHWKL